MTLALIKSGNDFCTLVNLKGSNLFNGDGDIYKVWIGEPEDKRCELCRHPQGSNVKLDPKEIAWEGAYWIHFRHNKNHWQAVVKMVKWWKF